MKRFSTGFMVVVLSMAFLVSCKNKSQEQQENLPPQLVELNKKIEKDGKNAALYDERAHFYLSSEQLNNALADARKAIELDAKNPKYFYTLSSIYVLMGKPQDALDALNKALEINPQSVETLLQRAKLYLVMKDYEHCAENVEKIFEIEPNNANAFYMKGMVLDEVGDTLKAITNYQKALQNDPNHFDALVQLGGLFSKKNPPLAMEYYKTATSLKPTDMATLYNLGILYQENNRRPEAIQTYEQILKLNPRNQVILYNLGYIELVYERDFPKAVEYFTKAIEIDSVYAEAYYNRGYSYELMHEYQRARNDYNRSLQIETNYDKAIEGLNRLDKK